MTRLRILCISDKIDPLIYSSNIKNRFNDIDLVLSAGDLELKYYGFIVSSLNKPLLFVFGNHNLKCMHRYRHKNDRYDVEKQGIITGFPPSYGSIYLGDRVKNIKSLLLAGLGGSMKYNNGPNQFSEFEMVLKIFKILPKLFFNRIFYGRWLDILLTHAPPRGLGDKEDRCHQGFKVFRTFLKYFKPRYLLHGHIHLYDINAPREIQFMETRIINIYEHQIIDIEVS
ncbi:MAG: metallophosphoesterase [Spirochaetales bacterium]|nr:metallophosphoesterase [Spirochaetales bacterium]